jgi:hypothetical protein
MNEWMIEWMNPLFNEREAGANPCYKAKGKQARRNLD